MASKYVAIALAVWLTSAVFLGIPASAAPQHVVGGGIRGPGGIVDPGPTNPANAAGVAFYLTNQPFPRIIGADSFTPADGTDPALFAKDVGAVWNWTNGDSLVVVAETRRGVSGWTGVNYTTSLDALLQSGPPIQDIGDGTLEALPTLTLLIGSDWVNVTWTGLTDANGNLVSYEVYRGNAPGGPFGRLATSPQRANAYHNDTGLAVGRYCYQIAVNYRADGSGSLYETSGRSETVCRVLAGIPPTIQNTNPANGASSVAATANIVVTFSEAMNTATVTWTINPTVTLTPAWSGGNTILTLSHATAFVDCTSYQVGIPTGLDLDGDSLVPGPVPNPWTFTTTCPAPFVTLTSPANGATMVRRDRPVVITFSEAMNTATVTVSFTPTVSANPCVWSVGDTVCTVTHSGFTGGTTYTVDVAGQDPDGNALVAGPVPRPWSFTTNNPPTAVLTAPPVGVCRSGGASLSISWTMSDAETAVGSLRVWLNYTDGVTTSPIAGPLTGLPSPATFAWTTPTIDANVQVLVEVVDGAGEKAQLISPAVRIDSTAPTAVLTSPAPGATDVPTDAPVVLTFSEAMNQTATEPAVTFAPTVSGLTYTWSGSDTVLTIDHAAFQTGLLYTVTVGTAAKDTCSPGLGLASAYSAQFTTGAGVKAPKPPTNLRVTSATATAIALAWDAPTQYTDNSTLPEAEISGYEVYRSTSATGQRTRITTTTAKTYIDTNVVAGTEYFYWVKAVDSQSRVSDFSAMTSARAGTVTEEGLNPLVILIPLIVVLLLIGAFLLMRRKKPEAEPSMERPPRREAPPEEPLEEEGALEEAVEEPLEEAPAEEPAEETEAKFMPCPNCGTMVKPTDAECFVCGTKL